MGSSEDTASALFPDIEKKKVKHTIFNVHYCIFGIVFVFLEVLLEPDTKFTVMLISQEEGTGITRVVLAVKETEPILKKEMDTFKAAYEKIEWDIDENYEKEVSERMIERMKAQVTQFPLASSGSIGSFSQGGIGQELSFSSSSPMNIGNIEPTGNIQERSSISILETSRGNLNAGEGEQVNMPTIFQ